MPCCAGKHHEGSGRRRDSDKAEAGVPRTSNEDYLHHAVAPTRPNRKERSITVKTFCVLGSILYALAVVLIGKFCGLTSTPDVASSESLARLAVKDGGGVWVGIQECEGMSYSLTLFNAPSGSTLALKTSDCSKVRVQQRIQEHMTSWQNALRKNVNDETK